MILIYKFKGNFWYLRNFCSMINFVLQSLRVASMFINFIKFDIIVIISLFKPNINFFSFEAYLN